MGVINRTTDEINTLLDKVANLPEEDTSGKDGKTPILETGTTTTLEAGSQATSEVVRNGEDASGNPKYKINFGIPRGQDGIDGGGVADSVEWDNVTNKPTWVTSTTKPTYTAKEVGALPSDTSIPTKTSELENDSNFTTTSSFKTINGNSILGEGNLEIASGGGGVADSVEWNKVLNKPQWVISDTKPTYTASEVGAIATGGLKTINGESLEGKGNIEISGSGSGIPDAPADNEIYGRKNNNWEKIVSEQQYLDLSMFVGESGTLSEENYQKVIDAYNNEISIFELDMNGEKLKVHGLGIVDADVYYMIFFSFSLNYPQPVTNMCTITIDKDTKDYTYKTGTIPFEISGNGTKALADNGRYVEFIPEAPADGKTYGRKNKSWAEIVASGMQIFDATELAELVDAGESDLSPTLKEAIVSAYENKTAYADVDGTLYSLVISPKSIGYDLVIQNIMPYGSNGLYYIALDVDVDITTDKITVKSNMMMIPSEAQVVLEAPTDGKTYGRNNKKWVEITSSSGGSGGQQYLDLSMFTEETGTLSDEDYQKIVDAYESGVSIAKKTHVNLDGNYATYYGNSIIDAEEFYLFTGLGRANLLGYDYSILTFSVIKSDKSYACIEKTFIFQKDGSGTRALTDNGSYAAFAPEAPKDGKAYVRKNGEWVDIKTLG